MLCSPRSKTKDINKDIKHWSNTGKELLNPRPTQTGRLLSLRDRPCSVCLAWSPSRVELDPEAVPTLWASRKSQKISVLFWERSTYGNSLLRLLKPHMGGRLFRCSDSHSIGFCCSVCTQFLWPRRHSSRLTALRVWKLALSSVESFLGH